MSKTDEKVNFWVTIAADLDNRDIALVGCARNFHATLKHHKRTKLPHCRSFKMDGNPKEMLLWFVSIGASEEDARKAVVQVSDALLKVMTK